MSENITSYPLVWPRQAPRAKKKIWGQFEATPGQVVRELLKEIDRLVLKEQAKNYTLNKGVVIISCNARLNADGSPNARDMDSPMGDPGVAVYFPLNGRTVCVALDQYDKIWKNLRAVQRTLEAMRAIERYGGSGMLEQAFTGFAALPAPGETKARTCWEVLGIACTQDAKAIDEAWRVRAKVCHPDMPGGSHEAMTELNTARDQAQLQARGN